MALIEYRIYYGDHTTYTGPPEIAPERDVQVIIQKDPKLGWVSTHTHDFYTWQNERWQGVDIFGLWDYLARDGWKRVLFGRTLLRDEFNEIYQWAKQDKTFARKNGFLPNELKP